ncbi:MAG: hypothetical protein HUK03_04740 [Bacteroidaceae bacterium]|nr:hypothetical protein [Bacteroidaceae bacterium]
MRLKHIIPSCLFMLAITACDDSYNDQFGFLKDNGLIDVKKETIALGTNDYSNVAKMALELKGNTPSSLPGIDSAALRRIDSLHCFKDESQAAELLPLLLKNRYTTADESSVITVQFDLERGASKYLADFKDDLVSYTLSEDDYKEVWGDKVKASYLTPKTLAQIPALLKKNVPDDGASKFCVAEYAYDTVEPSIGGGGSVDPTPSAWTEVEVPGWPSGSDWTFVGSGDVDLSAFADKQIQIAFQYSSNETVAPTWEVESLIVYDKNGDEQYIHELKTQESYDLFTTEGDLPEGISYVWKCDVGKYAKASAYVSGTRYVTCVKLVSPWMSIGKGCTFDFRHACNFANGDPKSYAKVLVRSMDGAKKKTRAADIAANTASLYRFDGSSWKAYGDNDEAQVAVVNPAAYATTGGCFGNPDTQLPTYLASTYIYATDGDKVCLVYKKSADAYAFAEYEFVNAMWQKTALTTQSALDFTLKGGEWSADMSTYYSSTLLGEEGGLTPVNTLLGEGLSYVWSNTALYGWKGTAYVNKTNVESVSYLVTPVIRLKNAKKPVVVYDEAYRYTTRDEVTNMLQVLVTANYTGDPATTEWKDITPAATDRSDGSTWNFFTIPSISLSDYIDQKIVIAFRYSSNAEMAPTWEIKNLIVKEAE